MTDDAQDDGGTPARQHSRLEEHYREGSRLVPPLNRLDIELHSWRDERLPDCLWALLLATQVERESLLAGFRRIAMLFDETPEGLQPDCTHCGLVLLPDGLVDEFFELLSRDRTIVPALRPLLLFEGLPLRHRWRALIGDEPDEDAWVQLERSITQSLDHQSQPSTDTRWLRVACFLRGGRLHFVQGTEETAKCILGYPDYGPPGLGQSVIRAAEGAISGFMQDCGDERQWPAQFWDQCWENTPCGDGIPFSVAPPEAPGTTLQKMQDARAALRRHASETTRTTDVDAAHEATFGLADYSLAILDELLRMGNPTSILGRLGLRTLVECLITLKYMDAQDNLDIWLSYRRYGSGQAKLSFLKQDRLASSGAEGIDASVLERLANEDRWMEFSDVDLGHWHGTDLRSMAMSDNVDLKEEYDRYYDWTSAFAHANWAAVRNASFGLCGNSLHRMHRVLRGETASLEDCISGASRVVDQILKIVDERYPSFEERVTVQQEDPANQIEAEAG